MLLLKIIFSCVTLLYVADGLPQRYSDATAVSHFYFRQNTAPVTQQQQNQQQEEQQQSFEEIQKNFAARVPTVHAQPINTVQDAPIAVSRENLLQSHNGNQVISQYSKDVDTMYSSVQNFDTRITNNGGQLPITIPRSDLLVQLRLPQNTNYVTQTTPSYQQYANDGSQTLIYRTNSQQQAPLIIAYNLPQQNNVPQLSTSQVVQQQPQLQQQQQQQQNFIQQQYAVQENPQFLTQQDIQKPIQQVVQNPQPQVVQNSVPQTKATSQVSYSSAADVAHASFKGPNAQYEW